MRNNTPELPVAQHLNSTGHSISDFQVCGVGMALCSGTDIQPKQREMRVFCSKEPFKPKGLNINFSWACHYLHAHAPHFMSMTIVRRRNNNGFLDSEEELFTRNVCFVKTFDPVEYYPIRNP